ncbi:MAG: two-component regulator propeller domain-containing protein, partial [Bacteroidota bacterium]
MKNLIKTFPALLIALLFSLNITNAQTWTNYTTADGLVNNDVQAIAIDAQGNKWFGTYGGGVSKFDGINWTTYTTVDGLASDDVRAIATDAQGNMWFGTYFGGVTKFDGANWITYTTADGLGGNYVTSIAIDAQGNKWFGTNNGVSRFDGTNWTTYTTADGLGDNNVTSLAIDFQGNKWVGSYNAGISRFDGINWTTYNIADGLVNNWVRSIAVDVYNNIWVGTDIQTLPLPCGISKYDGINWTTYPIPSGTYCKEYWTIVFDALDNMWIANGYWVIKFDGVYCYGIFGHWTYAIAIDNQGNKWFGTKNEGVWKLSDGGAGPLSSVCVIKGNIFYDNNENGIFDNGETTLSGKIVEVLNDSIFYTTQSNGSYYIPRDTGTYQIKCIPAPYWQFTTDSIITVEVSDTSTYIDNNDFGIKMDDAASDVSVDIAGGPTRAGFDAHYWITYKNEASVTKNGSVILTIDSLTSFVSSTPPPDSQNGNLITWNYVNLVMLEQRQVQLFLHMPDVSHLGDTLTTTAIINPVPGDILPVNNYDTLHQVLTGSYDPNDKSVDKGTKENGYTLLGEELTYTVRFQNTGTDTAFTVQIRDTIDSDLD